MGRYGALKIFGVICVLFFAGCSTAPKDTTAGEEEISSESVDMIDEADMVDSSTYGASAGTSASGESIEMMNADAELLKMKIIYFDFDKSVIRPEAYAALKAHARRLAENTGMSVRLEGHADERGTREYNLALGERRAQAVAKFLRLNGVSASQLDIVSYGEEKPLSMGQGEAAWAKNRRVEINYK